MVAHCLVVLEHLSQCYSDTCPFPTIKCMYLFIYPLFNWDGLAEIQYVGCQGVLVKLGSK